MSYVALYRKFRPTVFGDVKGQEHIVTTLKNQIIANRIGHAYLFCGTRGTGKTTIAKILAKSVNCENPVNGDPCGECASCKKIAAGNSMNVMEIDAASNNGVGNVREIIEEVSFSPAEGKYKVYIIDEVHMLTTEAFNALLKTLEEPPSYAVFILATTEVHKIPITVLSRCQRYDFKRITIQTITERLQELMQEENIEVEESALRYVAKAGDGSMRDSLSLLDQCIAFHYGEKLTYNMVLEVLGAVDTEVFDRLFTYVANRDVLACIELLEEVVIQGRELTQFVNDFTWYLRNLMLLKNADDMDEMENVIEVSKENLARMKEVAEKAELGTILRFIRIFSELSGKIKYAAQKRILVEVALIKLCKPAMETAEDSLLDRIRALEDKVEQGIAYVPVAGSEGMNTGAPAPAKPRPTLERALPEDLQKVVQMWKRIVDNLSSPLLKRWIAKGKLSVSNDDKLLLVLTDANEYSWVMQHPEHLEQLEKEIEDSIGKAVEVEIRNVSDEKEFEQNYIDIMGAINMDIEVDHDEE